MLTIPSKPTLGRLEKVTNLRSYWPHEAVDFTPWLAHAENIKLLEDAIGMELEVESSEAAVGPFSADILCKDTASDNWVLVENQLERTDHIHLGQLLTYAAGLNAVTIVWIAARFTDEHRAALDWLNERTDERINFFGLEIELWKIGESAIAPKFNVVSKPNDWTKSGLGGATGQITSGSLTPNKQLQVEYWSAFRAYVLEQGSALKPTKPLPQHWMNLAIGRSGFVLQAIASLWDSALSNYDSNEIRAELALTDNNSKVYYELLAQRREEIENLVGEPLIWYNPSDVKVCRLYLRRTANISDKTAWPEQHAWLKSKLERLYQVFRPIVKDLDPGSLPQDENPVS